MTTRWNLDDMMKDTKTDQKKGVQQVSGQGELKDNRTAAAGVLTVLQTVIQVTLPSR